MKLNITKIRLAVLRLVQQRPGMDAHSLAQFLYDGNHIKRGEYYKDEAPKHSRNFTGQGSARLSGSISKPLIEAGLIKKTNEFRRFSRDKLYITKLGLEKLK